MTDDAQVSLHTGRRRVAGVRAVLVDAPVGPRVVVLPWPVSLSVLTPFAVAVTTPASTRWFSVTDLEILIEQADRPQSVGFLTLSEPPVGVTVEKLHGVSSQNLRAAMANQPDLAQALTSLHEPAFALLGPAVGRLRAVTGRPPAGTLSVPRYVVTPGPPDRTPAGICRILGWD